MFQLKTRARFLTHGTKAKGVMLFFLPFFAFLGFALSLLLFVLCKYYSVKTVFEGWFFEDTIKNYPVLQSVVKYFFLIAAALFLLFFYSFRFALRAYFYYKTDKNQSRPKSFISFNTGAKMLCCGALLFALKAAFFALFLLPCGVSSAVIYMLLMSYGIPKITLYIGISITVLQFFGALAAAFIFFGRYYMTEYLLYLNPLMSVREAVFSSAMLMRNKLLSTALFRLQTLPWRIIKAGVITFPFAFSYSSLLTAVMREKIFAEDKTKVNEPAITFFINKKSKFFQTNVCNFKTDVL